MGYVNGKTEVDLLLEEDDMEEDYERIAVIQVTVHKLPTVFPQWPRDIKEIQHLIISDLAVTRSPKGGDKSIDLSLSLLSLAAKPLKSSSADCR